MVLTVHLQPHCQAPIRRVLYHWLVYQSCLALATPTEIITKP